MWNFILKQLDSSERTPAAPQELADIITSFYIFICDEKY